MTDAKDNDEDVNNQVNNNSSVHALLASALSQISRDRMTKELIADVISSLN